MCRLLVITLLFTSAAAAQNTSDVYSSADRPRALALIGDRYHSPAYIRDNLLPAFARENVPIAFIENHEALTAEALKDYDLLIFLKDGMIWPNGYKADHVKWMTDAHQKAVWDFVHNGGGFLALHNSHGIYPPGGLYYKLFGGDYGGHPPPATFTIRIENKKHPITQGVEDFQTFDEQHMSKYDLDREHLLMRNISVGNKSAPAGWWRELGRGRFVYLAPGHTPEALGHPMMQRLVRNSIRWLTRASEK
jgi:type 1 glutamine amidotransferase